ncbi:MAG: hypothetical protein K2Q12_10420 [Rickettsiales bacterium]|nr:hypothetical protein [Rickettsiales bacterium]
MKNEHGGKSTASLRQNILPLPVTTSYQREDFCLADSNRWAYEALMAWPNWPKQTMALVGPAGSGKTHLAHIWAMHACAQEIQLQQGEPIPELLLYANGSAVFWIDNAESCEETKLFHILNLAQEIGFTLLLSAVDHYTPALADLRSRWNALPRAALYTPDDHLLQRAFIKQCADRQLTISEEVAAYLLKRIPRTVSCISQLLDDIDRVSLTSQRAITIHSAREALERLGFS